MNRKWIPLGIVLALTFVRLAHAQEISIEERTVLSLDSAFWGTYNTCDLTSFDKYFTNEPMDDTNRLLFAFAAYNAGPGRIHSLREAALKRGLDPNVWVNNVEMMAAEKIGMETVTYVANIYKYYVAYKLVAQQAEERKKAKESLENGP